MEFPVELQRNYQGIAESNPEELLEELRKKLWKNFQAIPGGTPEEVPRNFWMKSKEIAEGTPVNSIKTLRELRRNSRKNSWEILKGTLKVFSEELCRISRSTIFKKVEIMRDIICFPFLWRISKGIPGGVLKILWRNSEKFVEKFGKINCGGKH